MKTLGLVGGTGWVSTIEYYRIVNEEVNRRLGGHEAARCILYSLNFGDVMRGREQDPQEQGAVRDLVIDAARRLEKAGVDGLMLCANTMHWFADAVEREVRLPLVHIADATGKQALAQGLGCVGLLGTRPTMERDFWRRRLDVLGIELIIPDEPDRSYVDRAIYEELVRDRFLPETRMEFLAVMHRLRLRGAQGIVLGCTEIPLLLKPGDTDMPLLDTLRLHASAGVAFMLGHG